MNIIPLLYLLIIKTEIMYRAKSLDFSAIYNDMSKKKLNNLRVWLLQNKMK